MSSMSSLADLRRNFSEVVIFIFPGQCIHVQVQLSRNFYILRLRLTWESKPLISNCPGRIIYITKSKKLGLRYALLLLPLLSPLLSPSNTLLPTNSESSQTRFLSLPVPNVKLKNASLLIAFMNSCTSAKKSTRDSPRVRGERGGWLGMDEGGHVREPRFCPYTQRYRIW